MVNAAIRVGQGHSEVSEKMHLKFGGCTKLWILTFSDPLSHNGT